ncbi:hypothetical protein [Pseudanabaena yagii]|uniref:Uncharacterized protein n=1 Tax=Pseudanabaena yagii GIHE-NHR1 TaxID=2722753 RepID=A0ABX1LQ52_9CYAN|nr:hypothetical protein [Pseudanabaena yagii]NMF57463.1 hypothetical protein [Pseudanabaena yagii GIHE-NHR1]
MNSNENVPKLIRDLQELSNNYIGVEIQKEKYIEILRFLRQIYRENNQEFSPERIFLINSLKEDINKINQIYIPNRIKPVIFFQRKDCVEATSYVRVGIPLGTIVFNKNNYSVAVVCDRNVLNHTCKLFFFKEGFEWVKISELIAIGRCEKRTRFTYCWSCQDTLGIGDMQCNKCGWYKCTSCGACGCS